MNKFSMLVILGFTVVLVLPVFNDMWKSLADIFIDMFGITADSPTGITFYVWVRAMPYIVIGVAAVMAFKIIKGGGGDSEV